MPEQKLSANPNFKALMKAGIQTKKIAITGISTHGCSALTTLNINHREVVTLQLFDKQDDGKYNPYTPFPAVVESATKRKLKDKDVFDVKLKFNKTIYTKHGVVQVMNNTVKKETSKKEISVPASEHAPVSNANSSTKEISASENKSLFDVFVRCHMCGHPHIPFRSLKTRSMVTKTNIFGVPKYIEAQPGEEFCDFNLVRITVCPSCYFASGNIDDFVREKKTVKKVGDLFNKEPIVEQWNANESERRALISMNMNGFFSEERSLDQALISYDLAIASCDAIMNSEKQKKENLRNYEVGRKAAYYMVIKAEMLLQNKKPEAAEELLNQAIPRLEECFLYTRRESSIKAAFLLGMLGIYFENLELARKYFGFLQVYEKENKVRSGTEQQKILASSLKKLSEAYEFRDDYSKNKLKGFDPPF